MTADDFSTATTDDAHRTVLHAAGGASLSPRPWQHRNQPASDGELVRLAAWKAREQDVEPEVITAGLGLLSAARAELDQVEAGLLFAARAAGMTFQQIAAALDLGSSQAAQQRLTRVTQRLDDHS